MAAQTNIPFLSIHLQERSKLLHRLPVYDSDYSDFEWERDMQILWAEFDKAKAELDADLEKKGWRRKQGKQRGRRRGCSVVGGDGGGK